MKKLITILALILGACGTKQDAQVGMTSAELNHFADSLENVGKLHEYQLEVDSVNNITLFDRGRFVGKTSAKTLDTLISYDNQ